MADDTTLGAAVGSGDVISTDDLGTKKVQRVKVQHGADGSATDVSTASPLPAVLQTAQVADGGALPATGVQVGGTDGSVFQVLSTDNAGRLNANINGTVTTTGPLTDTQLRATPVPVSGTVTASGPLTDTQLRATPVPVSGTVTANGAVTNAGTFAVQDSQKVADNAGFTDGTTPVQPAGYIFDEVAGTALTENDAAAARIDSKRAQVGVIEDATTRGQRAAVSAGGALKVDGSAVTQPVSLATLPVTNAGTFAVQIAANSSVNQAQVAGTATSVNSGTKDAGTQRVILASDQTVVPVSDNAGSLTVDAPVGTPVFVRLSDGSSAIATLPVSLASLPALAAGSAQVGTVGITPQTTGGFATPFHLISAATTNATNVKASAGQLFGWYIRNLSTGDRKVAFHNTAGTPTAGAGVVFTINLPAGAGANVFNDIGIPFATGIALTTVTDAADAGTTAVAAGDLDINLFFK